MDTNANDDASSQSPSTGGGGPGELTSASSEGVSSNGEEAASTEGDSEFDDHRLRHRIQAALDRSDSPGTAYPTNHLSGASPAGDRPPTGPQDRSE